MINDINGNDISEMLSRAAGNCPEHVLLACIIAESGFNPYAERWGKRTADAKVAMRSGDTKALQTIIDSEWPDISFGFCQQIVLYHYWGDHTPTSDNCQQVRLRVFTHPEEAMADAANRLYNNILLARASDLKAVSGDPELGALVIYNSGHLRPYGDPWWQQYRGNVVAYSNALGRAKELLGKNMDNDHLVSLIGYLQGDVAAAIRGPLEAMLPSLKVNGKNWQRAKSALDAVSTLENAK